MSATSTKPCCVTCGKEISVLKCEGCWKTGCSGQSTVTEQTAKAKQQHTLIQQVDDWECNALNQIRQTAEEARRLILKHTTYQVSKVQEKLLKLSGQLQQCHQENNFISQNVSQWHAELAQLTKQLSTPSTITVRQVSSPLVTKIFVDIPALLSTPNIHANAKWIQNGSTVAGGNGRGNGLNQLNHPFDVYVDDDQTIYVANGSNSRVMEWKSGATSGQVVASGNGLGNQANQLSSSTAVIVDKESDSLIICDHSNARVVRWPRQNGTTGEIIISDVTSFGLTMDSYGYLYVCHYYKHEVKRWKMGETNGTVVAGGNGQGGRLDQLDGPMHIFVDEDHSVYVTDIRNHRVMKWVEGAKEGIVVAGGQGQGSGVTQLYDPWGVVVDQLGTVYVADQGNHRVMRWTKGATQGSVVVGGNGGGAQPNQFNMCRGLSFDGQGNLFVVDYSNHRVQKFTIDPNSIQ